MNLPCLACASAETSRDGAEAGERTSPETPFLNALVLIEMYSYDDVRRSLCHKHADHVRQLLRAAARVQKPTVFR